MSSLFHSSRPPTPSSINVDSSFDNRITATAAGTSNISFDDPLESSLPPTMVGINRASDTTVASTITDLMRPQNPIPASPSMPDVPRKVDSTNNSAAQASSTPMSLPSANNKFSILDGAENVYMHHPTIIMANNVQQVSNADGNKNSNARILNVLSEKLLPRARFAEYDAASPAPRNACTENTRKGILDTLRLWASDNTTTKVYWLNGMAGTGKTTIAYSFSEILDEEESLGGTFFSSHLRVDTSDVRCIIPTISLQLAKYLPSLSPHILEAVEANPDCSSWKIGKQFLNFMVKPLTAAYRETRVVVDSVIVLDALDECSDQSLVADLLAVIFKHSKSLPVKFLITSRPEIRLKQSFAKSWSHSNFILHEVEKEIVKADIELYIKACLLDGLNRPSQAELQSLVNLSGVLFIYAATVCKYIAQRDHSSMSRRLSDVVNSALETTSGLTHPLDVLYERILDGAYASTNHGEAVDINMVLTAVVYAYNPLSMRAISALMEMPIEQIEAALSPLHSLIYIPSQDHNVPISTFHASFPDFISNQVLAQKHYLDPCASHMSLALQCLSLMDKEWSQKERVSYLAERKCQEISESLAYACSSWAFHFTDTGNNNRSDKLEYFFQRHLLRWMDCLSILGKLKTAMHALHNLEIWANAHKLLKLKVVDAERFLKECFEFINHNSLEACPSALAWLPKNSEIWKTYGSKMDCPWNLCVGRRKAWSMCEAILRHSNIVNFAAFSPDSRLIVTASHIQPARIWNTATGQCEAELKGHSKYINSAAFSPNGMHIVTASDDHTARIWNIATGECEAELKGHLADVNSAVFSPDSMHVVTASYDHTARIWNTITGECKAELKGHSDNVKSAVFSPDGIHIVSASYDNTARIWNTVTGECKAELKGHLGKVNSAVFSSDGMHIVSASDDCTAQIWNTATGKCEAKLKGHSKWINSAVFSPDGMHIVSASRDSTARIWNAATGECEAELKGYSGYVTSAVFSPDGMHIMSVSYDGPPKIWNTATGKREAELKGHSGNVNSAVFSPDGMHIVSTSSDYTARIWNTVIEQYEAELQGHSGSVGSAVFSSDGINVVSASDDCTARIWNTVTQECEAELKGHSYRIISAVFSPDGMHIVTASNDCTAWIWNTATGECEAKLKGHSGTVKSAVFSPDSMHIVTVSSDDPVKIWNIATGECEAELKGHSGNVNSAVFSSDGMHVVSASSDTTIRIWDTATGKCEKRLMGYSDLGYVYSAVFSSDGMNVVSVSSGHTVQIWDVATRKCEVEEKYTSVPSSSHDLPISVLSPLSNGVFIHENFHGQLCLSSQPSFLGISKDTVFHTKNLQTIWIPPPFRNPTSISHHLSKICLGYGSGEVLVLEFQESKFDPTIEV